MIKRIALSAIIALCAFMMQAQEKTYTLKIGDFNKITVANTLDVIYRCNPDSAGYAVYTCSPKTASAITFSNDSGKKLKIQVIADTLPADLPTVTVYSLALSQAENWGDGTIYVEDSNPGVSFKADVIGNGNITVRNIHCTEVGASVKAGSGHVFLSGIAQKAKYTIMSAGAIEAAKLQAANVKCRMLGTGAIDCYASETLTVDGMGTGKIFYIGTPTIKKHSVGVKILPVE